MIKNGGNAISESVTSSECCMCGDYGLSLELFKCKDCQFRSQHKYCSNLYPEAESYNTCNWCLSQKSDGKSRTVTTQDSSNISSSSQQKIPTNKKDFMNIKKKKRLVKKNDEENHKGSTEIKRASTKQVMIKKHDDKFSNDRPMKRKSTSGGCIAERLIKRTRSEDRLSNGQKMIKQVLRNKVIRRYKLLDEVSSQPVNAKI